VSNQNSQINKKKQSLLQKTDSVSELAKEELPSISIVVPNYNGEKTIGKALQSLVDQGYPSLEVVVVDGGSSDRSVEIIQAFAPYISWWVSEKDNGQSSAINKGFSHCTGEVVNWLCSDDTLTPRALHTVGEYFARDPDLDVLLGGCNNINLHKDNESYVRYASQKSVDLMPAASGAVAQPSCFYRRALLNRAQPIDESYHYAMDFELWNHFKSQNAKWQCIKDVLSVATQDGMNKSSTGGEKVTFELERVYKNYSKERIPLTFWHRRLRYPLERFIGNHPSRIWLYFVGPVWIGITLLLSLFYGFDRAWIMRWKRWA